MEIISLIILIGGLLTLIILRIPVAFSFALISLFYMIFTEGLDFSYTLIANRFLYGVNNFSLIAVPFFIFAANLMNASGITKKLFRFAKALVGNIPGGLGQVNIIASLIFSGMSGSATSDAAGLGAIEIKAMVDNGYDKGFAVGITAASSTIGPIFPPSVPLVIYGVTAGVSVGKLLLAGICPAFIMVAALMLMVFFYSRKKKCYIEEKFALKEFLESFWEAIPSLITPIIIIGGILGG